MKTEDLQALGLTEEQVKKVFELNGKDLKAEQKKTEKAEEERDSWKERADTAEKTLKDFDGVDVDGLNQQIKDWKEKAEQAEKDYAQKLYDRDFADALNVEMEKFKFTSEAAKKAIMAEVKEAGLKLKDGKILGLNDLITQIKEKDASAFAPETDPPKFTDPPKGGSNGGSNKSLKDMSLDERIKLKQSNPDYYNKLRRGE